MDAEHAGRTLRGRYLLTQVVGGGGMGVVYEAVELDLGRKVAVKLLSAESERARARFAAEAQAAASIHHPNVVVVTDFHVGDARDPPFLVMELLAGTSLKEVMAAEGAMPTGRAVHIAAQILEGLSAAHAAGVVHRDVKPSNVLLLPLPGGRSLVKLVDFGIAKLVDDPGGLRTTAGSFIGTPAYAAPEQLLAEKVDARTDVYGVGVCLYEMLTGTRLRAAADPARIVALALGEPPACIERPGVPQALAEAVARSLTRRPADRWPDAAAFLAALAPFLDERQDPALLARTEIDPPFARSRARPPARWTRAATFVVSMMVAIAAGAFVLSGLVRSREPDVSGRREEAAASDSRQAALPEAAALAPAPMSGHPEDAATSSPPADRAHATTTRTAMAPRPPPSAPPGPSTPREPAPASPRPMPPFLLGLAGASDGDYEACRAWFSAHAKALTAACFSERPCATDVYVWEASVRTTTASTMYLAPEGCNARIEPCVVGFVREQPLPRASRLACDGGRCPSASIHLTLVRQ